MVGKIGIEPIHPGERDLQSPATLQLRRLPILKYTAHLRKQFDCSTMYFNMVPPPRLELGRSRTGF